MYQQAAVDALTISSGGECAGDAQVDGRTRWIERRPGRPQRALRRSLRGPGGARCSGDEVRVDRRWGGRGRFSGRRRHLGRRLARLGQRSQVDANERRKAADPTRAAGALGVLARATSLIVGAAGGGAPATRAVKRLRDAPREARRRRGVGRCHKPTGGHTTPLVAEDVRGMKRRARAGNLKRELHLDES
jgi:hypothetical protein